MNVISALSLFAVLLYLYMGIFIYKANRVSKLNRLFMLWCLSMAAWSFGYSFVYIATGSHNLWIKVSAVGWCFFGAFALHQILLLTENKLTKKPFLDICLYLPGTVFWCLSIFVFHSDKTVSNHLENFYYSGSSIYTFAFLTLTMGLLISWYFRNRDSLRIVIQAKILLITCSVASILVLLTHIILPFFGMGELPLLAHLYALIVLSGIYYAMKHYRLLNVPPQILNDMIFSEMLDLAILLSPDGNIQKISKSTETLLGYQTIDLMDKPITSILNNQDIFSDMMTVKSSPVVRRYSDAQCITRSGEILPVSLSCLPLMAGRLNEPEGFVLLGHDIRVTKQLERQIEEQKVTEEKITYLAYHDALTGLANRKYFYEKLHIELERSFRKGDKTAILFLDLDGFKQINDNYGHEAGDILLHEVANRIKSNIREIDTVARMGGDEFTLLIVDITSRSAAEAIANKIEVMLDNPILIDNMPVYIQASIGISIFPDDGRDMKQLVSKADNEMYAVKLKRRSKKKALPY